MKITEIKMNKYFTEGTLKAIMSVTLDDCIAIHNIKVIELDGVRFMSMPSQQNKKGEHYSIVHPTNNETRQILEKLVLNAYAGYAYMHETYG